MKSRTKILFLFYCRRRKKQNINALFEISNSIIQLYISFPNLPFLFPSLIVTFLLNFSLLLITVFSFRQQNKQFLFQIAKTKFHEYMSRNNSNKSKFSLSISQENQHTKNQKRKRKKKPTPTKQVSFKEIKIFQIRFSALTTQTMKLP